MARTLDLEPDFCHSRRELVEQYRDLTAAAEERAAHAQWKERRLQLDETRRRFLQQEEEALQKELQEKPLPPGVSHRLLPGVSDLAAILQATPPRAACLLWCV